MESAGLRAEQQRKSERATTVAIPLEVFRSMVFRIEPPPASSRAWTLAISVFGFSWNVATLNLRKVGFWAPATPQRRHSIPVVLTYLETMTNVNPVATLIFFVSASSCIIVANYLSYRMLRQVNSDLPEAKVPQVKSRFLLLMAIGSTLACAWELGFLRSLLDR